MILRAQPEHADTLTSITISAKQHWNYPKRWMELWLPQLTISAEYISSHETWMKVLAGSPVAYYSLILNSGLWLDNLWVLPEHMGRGFGRELLLDALERSRRLGASSLKIESDPNARSFYEHMGAVKIAESHGEVDGSLRVLPILEIKL